jgi:hypothetical protein
MLQSNISRGTSPEALIANGLGPLPAEADATSLYLDLIKRALANILYEDVPSWIFDRAASKIMAAERFHLEHRVRGEDSPTTAHTMIGMKRLDNIQFCLEEVLKNKVPGDVIETGVLAGGATIFMRAILKAYKDEQRRVFVCDSFMAHPTAHAPKIAQWMLKAAASVPDRAWQRQLFQFLQTVNPVKSLPNAKNPSDDLVDYAMQILQNADKMAIPKRDTSLEGVKSNFARYGLLDEQVVFVKGYFSETLPHVDSDTFSMIRLDGDLYESTMDSLGNLYPKLSPGGFCIIDDFSTLTDCRKAVEDYRLKHGITDPIQTIDYQAIFWQKS